METWLAFIVFIITMYQAIDSGLDILDALYISWVLAFLTYLSARIIFWAVRGLIRWIEDLPEELEPRRPLQGEEPWDRWERERRERARELVRERPPRLPPKPPRLMLFQLTLLLEPRQRRDHPRSLGRLVNPKKIKAIRPVAVIFLSDPTLVGRKLPLEFHLVGPHGGVLFECTLMTTLKLGVNRIIPKSEFPISQAKTIRGSWKIKLWAADRVWGETDFSISTDTLETLADQVVGADMEITASAEREARTLAEGATIDDLLD